MLRELFLEQAADHFLRRHARRHRALNEPAHELGSQREVKLLGHAEPLRAKAARGALLGAHGGELGELARAATLHVLPIPAAIYGYPSIDLREGPFACYASMMPGRFPLVCEWCGSRGNQRYCRQCSADKQCGAGKAMTLRPTPRKRRARRDLASLAVGAVVGGTLAAAGAALSHRDLKGRLFILPPYHEPGMKVPHGGTSCANCKWLDERRDGPHCVEPGFVLWNRGTKIPVADARDYCSDWWEPAPGAYAKARRSSRTR